MDLGSQSQKSLILFLAKESRTLYTFLASKTAGIYQATKKTEFLKIIMFLDTEAKKIVCSTLRSVALLNDAHLMFYSSKESMLVKRAKDIFNSIGFENGISIKDKQTNPTKPLFINKGADTWENIGVARSTFDEVSQ